MQRTQSRMKKKMSTSQLSNDTKSFTIVFFFRIHFVFNLNNTIKKWPQKLIRHPKCLFLENFGIRINKMHINKPKNDTSNYQANAQQIFFDSRSLMAACLLSLVSKKISTSSGFFCFFCSLSRDECDVDALLWFLKTQWYDAHNLNRVVSFMHSRLNGNVGMWWIWSQSVTVQWVRIECLT